MAARLLESGRNDQAIQVLAGTETVSDLASRQVVSRKIVYAQTRKVRAARDNYLERSRGEALRASLFGRTVLG